MNAVQAHYDRLAVLFSLCDLCRLPLAILTKEPAIVIEDRFARPGKREHFDPAFYSKQASDTAQQYRLFQTRDQLLACALL